MKKFFYRVEENDSVLSLSQRFNLPSSKIIALNGLTAEIECGDLLYFEIDETLKTHRVGLNETPKTLAQKYCTTPQKLLDDNCTKYLYYSQVIVIK